MQIFEELRKNVPREPDLDWWSAHIYGKLGDVQSAFNQETKSIAVTNRGQLDEARRWYQKSLEALAELRELGNDNADTQELIRATEEKLAQCETQLK